MDLPLIGSTAAASSGVTAKSEASLADSFDTFLTLLTTQLRYQDPLEPMDSSEFTNQLVQFTEVEQSISTNKQLEQLIGMQGANQAVAALGYIGNTIEATGNQLPLVGSQAGFTYTLPENAANAKVLILNSAGQLVQTIDGNTTAGKHKMTWDGKSSGGVQLPDGAYVIAVSALTADQKALNVKTGIVGKVTGTQNDDTGAHLTIGSVPISLDKVVSVSKPSES